MTVAELIAALQTLPQDVPVLVRGYEYGAHLLTDRMVFATWMEPEAYPWDGMGGRHDVKWRGDAPDPGNEPCVFIGDNRSDD